MSNWLIQKFRKGKKYNVFDAKLHPDNRVMISLGDYSPFSGGSMELNVWFDEDDFNTIYNELSKIKNQIKNSYKEK
jgi:hypothetical protein